MRRLFTIASALSLLLCVAIIALWVRSYSVADRYSGREADWAFGFDSNMGALCFAASRVDGEVDDGHGFQRDKPYPSSPRVSWPGEPGVRSSVKIPGISWFATDGGAGPARVAPLPPGSEARSIPLGIWDPHTEVTISYWLLTALAGTLPGLRLLAWYRNPARRPIGHCRTCGYDLRASKDRCPECGAAIIEAGAKA